MGRVVTSQFTLHSASYVCVFPHHTTSGWCVTHAH